MKNGHDEPFNHTGIAGLIHSAAVFRDEVSMLLHDDHEHIIPISSACRSLMSCIL